jgi:hypothetical protein
MNHQQLLNEFYSEQPWLDLRGNDHFLIDTAGIPASIQGMRNAAHRLGSRLAIAPEYSNAWAEFTARYPRYAVAANRNLAFSLLNPHEEPSAQAFEEIANRASQPLTVSAAYLAQKSEKYERQRLILEITLGKDQYGAFDGRYGCIKYYPSSHLADETDERIREIHGIVTEQRRLAGLSPSEKRKESIPQATEFKLINPATGVEFTRKELINASKATLKWLVFGDSATAKPHVSERITAILKGNI